MDVLREHIVEEYGIECIPGGKVKCPKCERKTFAMKSDGSVAKCFHPSCSWVITPYCIEKRPSLHNLLSQLLHQWHGNLLNPGDIDQKAAMRYLTQDRCISPIVIEAAAIGLVPERPDIEGKLQILLNELRAAKPKPGRKRKGEFDAQVYADWLEEQGNDLITKVARLRNWLAFFYQDGKGRWCAIHFRKPGTKDFRTFKPKGMGLFGKDIFVPNCAKEHAGLNDFGLIVEGEFDCLTIQSVIVNAGLDAALVVATAGTTLLDTEAIKALIPKPVICQDNDEAGSKMVERIREAMHCEVCCPPPGFNDIDEYLNGFKDEPASGSYEALKNVVSTRKPLFQPFDAIREEIDNIRRGFPPTGFQRRNEKPEKLKLFEIFKFISETLIEDMSSRGDFYREGDQCFYFDKQTKNLQPIEKDGLGISLFLNRYGLNATEKLFMHVIEELTMHSHQKGSNVILRHYSYFHAVDKAPKLYVAVSGGLMLRIASDAVDLVDNGTDGIIFLSGETDIPYDQFYRNKVEDCHLLDDLILQRIPFLPGKLTRFESQLCLKCWILGFLFRSILPSMPLLSLIGPKGSGKTTALRLIGKVLCGESWDVTTLGDTESDFESLVTSKHLVVLDNVDGYKKWLNDKLAVVATGGQIPKRELYTTNRYKEFPIIATLAITSRTPCFKRDDVAERLLILETARIDESLQGDFVSDFDIFKKVIPRKPEIWAELLQICQAILNVMIDTDITQITVPGARMQDFARFTVIVGKALGCEKMTRGIWSKLNAIQNEFTLGDDNLFEILMIWVGLNTGRKIMAGELNNELREIADGRGEKWYYKNGHSLAQKLRHLKTNLKLYVRIEEEKGPSNQTLYTFYPAEEPESTIDSGMIPESIPEVENYSGSGIDEESRNHRNQIEENSEKKRTNDETEFLTYGESLPIKPGLPESDALSDTKKPPDIHMDKLAQMEKEPGYESWNRDRNRDRNRGGISPSPRPDSLSERYQQLFYERAGIREFDGGLSRDDAERAAWEDVQRLMRDKFLN